jgi:hypothetical protein
MTYKFIPHLLTFPRSGSHFFSDALYEEAQINFTHSHYVEELFDKDNKKQRPLITIARDPIDSISSYLALVEYRGSENEFLIPEKLTEYILMYSFLCENADYVIDFNDLVQHPNAVIKKMLTLLNINKDKHYLFDRNVIPKYKDFISSSKTLSTYKDNVLDNVDTDLCYFYYHKLLEKKIVI